MRSALPQRSPGMKAKPTERFVASLKAPPAGSSRSGVRRSRLRAQAQCDRRAFLGIAQRRPSKSHPVRLKVGSPDQPGRMTLAAARDKARTVMMQAGAPRADTVFAAAEEFIARHVLPTRRKRSANEAAARIDDPTARSRSTHCSAPRRPLFVPRPGCNGRCLILHSGRHVDRKKALVSNRTGAVLSQPRPIDS